MTSKVRVLVSKTFEEVRTIIHCEVGCERVKEKHFPLILLHFSKDLKKILCPFKIESHWEDVKAEWELEVKSKKQAVCIEVQIPEKVSECLCSDYYKLRMYSDWKNLQWQISYMLFAQRQMLQSTWRPEWAVDNPVREPHAHRSSTFIPQIWKKWE